MNKKFFLNLFCVLAMVINCSAQSFQKTGLGAKLNIKSIEIEIQFINPSTVRVIKSPEGTTFEKKSLSVIEIPQKTEFDIKEGSDQLVLKSKSVQVELNLKNGKISFSTLADEALLNEKEMGAGLGLVVRSRGEPHLLCAGERTDA
jgi:alpha-D-xyloside xylohydrolase